MGGICKLLDKRHHRKTIGLFLIGCWKIEKFRSSLYAVYYLRNFPIVQQPIRNKRMVFLMITFVKQFSSRISTANFRWKLTFYWRNLNTSKLFSTLKSINKFRKVFHIWVNFSQKFAITLENISKVFFSEIFVTFVVSSDLINVCKCIVSKSCRQP